MALDGEALRMVGGFIGGGVAAIMLAALPAPLPIVALAATSPPASVSPAPTPLRPQRSPEIEALVQRHNAAIGDMPYTSASWSGVITQNGSDTPYVAAGETGGRYRIAYSVPFGQRSEGSDGVNLWTQDVNGNVTTEPLAHPRSVASRLLGYNAAFFDRNLVWTLDGSGSVDGKTVYRMRTKLGLADAVFYVDSQSALLDRVEIADRVIRYPAYGRFGPLVLPTTIVDTEDDDTISVTVTGVTYTEPSADLFTIPTSRRPDFPAGESDISLNFDSPRSLIVVSVEVNGNRAKFLIDSGSSSSLIDLDAAKQLRLPLAGSARVAGARLLTGTVARVDNLDIGGIRYHPFVFEAVPLGLPASIRGYGIKGILGYDMLAQVVARIDYPRARVRLISPSSFVYAGTGAVIALDPATRVPRIPATLGQDDAVTFTVDTGSDSGLIVYEGFAASHTRDFVPPGDVERETCGPAGCQESSFFGDLTQANGAGGSIHVRTSLVARLSLGSFVVPKVFTEIVLQPTGAFVPTQSDGLLGAGVLSKFAAVFLDYSGHRFILER